MTGRRILLVLACAALVGLGAWFGLQRYAVDPRQDGVAGLYTRRWPDLTGKAVGLADFPGQTIVLNFWATWCAPCVEEMPEFSKVQTELAGKGVQFIGLAIDRADNVEKFVRKIPVAYPLLIADLNSFDLLRSLGDNAQALPFTLILGADRRVHAAHLGRLPEPELRALLARAQAAR